MSTEPTAPTVAPHSQRIRPWGSLDFPDFRWLCAATFLMNLGVQMRLFTNIWQVYELTGSPLQLGLTGLFQVLPLLGLALFAGPVADMVDRRKLIIVSQIVNIFPAMALALLTTSGAIHVWHIYVLTSLTSATNSFSAPAKYSMVASTVPKSHFMNAATLQQTGQQISALLAPVAAGLIVEAWGPGPAYIANAALCLLCLLALMGVKKEPPQASERPKVRFSSLVEGFQFVWVTPILVGLIALDTIAVLFGTYRPLTPVFAKDILHVGPAGLGVLLSAPAVGAILGNALVLGAGDVRRKGLLVICSTALYAGTLVVFGISEWFMLSMLALGALGLFDAVGVSVRHSSVLILTPENLRGRVTSARQIFSTGAPSLGYVVAGALGSVLGAPMAIVAGGAACGVGVVVMAWRNRQLREYR